MLKLLKKQTVLLALLSITGLHGTPWTLYQENIIEYYTKNSNTRIYRDNTIPLCIVNSGDNDWWLNCILGIPTTNTLDQAENILQGYTCARMNPEMALEIDTIKKLSSNLPKNFSIKQVSTPKEFKDWYSTAADCFDAGHELVYNFNKSYFNNRNKADVFFYIGYEDNTPVAVSLAHIGSRSIALDWVGVLPQYRNKGYGRCIVIAALKTPCPKTFQYAVLQSTPQAQTMYQKLGFKVTDELYVYFLEN